MNWTTLRLKHRWPIDILSGGLLMMLLWAFLITPATHGAGNPLLLQMNALTDPGSLAVKLQDTRAAFSAALAAQLSAETQRLLGEYDGIRTPSAALQNALLTDLNRLIQAQSLYDAQQFSEIELSEQTQALLEQNLQGGEDLVRLNRRLLAAAYPYEVAAPDAQRREEAAKGHLAQVPALIEDCRENLRQINAAMAAYQASENTERCEWLSALCPNYLDKSALLCPADATAGKPGVLTDGAADPTLPCSYLYEARPTEKDGLENLLVREGDMVPVVRCQHHRLNLSVSGKLYRDGPQRGIYTLNRMNIHLQLDGSGDMYAQLKSQLGEEFLESPAGKELLQKLAPLLPPASHSQELSPLIGEPMPELVLTTLKGEPVTLASFRGTVVLLSLFSTDNTACGTALQRLEETLVDVDAARVQAVAVHSGETSGQAMAAFQKEHHLSRLQVWVDKAAQLRERLNRDAAGLITIVLTAEGIVEAVLTDLPSLLEKVKTFIE